MDSADRIEALGESLHGLSARMLLSGALDDTGVKDAYEKVVAKFASLADDPTPPIEQSGLAGELEVTLENFLADRQFGENEPENDPKWREGFLAALDCLREELKPWKALGQPLRLTALTADKARDEALEEAAKVCEGGGHWGQTNMPATFSEAAKIYARAIRSLKGAAK